MLDSLISFPNASEIAFSVADFTILIKKSTNCPTLFLEEGFSEFMTEIPNSADITVTAFATLPEDLVEEKDLVYKATNKDQDFWSICKHLDGFKLITYSQNTPGIIQQIAIIDEEFKNWNIYSNPITDKKTGETGVSPLEYPMSPLLFYYLTVNHDAIMIHASGINDNSFGRIFSGFSGVGKSTMAKIWEKQGSTIINDDRMIIRKEGENYFVHNTPMFYVDQPKKVQLKKVYLPYHSPINKAEVLNPLKSVSKILGYCIIHGYNKQHLEHHLQFLSQLSVNHSTTLLGVVPDENITDFIKKHETEHPFYKS